MAKEKPRCPNCGFALPKKPGATMDRENSRQDWETPACFIEACVKRFGKISWDLAATEQNKKAHWFFSPEENSLTKYWAGIPGLLWLNPPFDDIPTWAEKCALEAARGARILFLTPSATGSNWHNDIVAPNANVKRLRPRITFVGATDPYPKDLQLAVFGMAAEGHAPGQGEDWRWR